MYIIITTIYKTHKIVLKILRGVIHKIVSPLRVEKIELGPFSVKRRTICESLWMILNTAIPLYTFVFCYCE